MKIMGLSNRTNVYPDRKSWACLACSMGLLPLLAACAVDGPAPGDLVSGTLLPSSSPDKVVSSTQTYGTTIPDRSAPRPDDPLLSADERKQAEDELKALSHSRQKPVTSSRRTIDQLKKLGKKHGEEALAEIEQTETE